MPRPQRSSKKVRLNLDMPPAVKERLEILRDSTHADSMSEVVRRALAVYEFVARESERGCQVYSRDEKGDETRIELI